MKHINALLLQYIDDNVKSWEGRTLVDIFNVKDIWKLTKFQQMYMKCKLIGLHKESNNDNTSLYKNKYDSILIWFSIDNGKISLTCSDGKWGSKKTYFLMKEDISDMVVAKEDLL